MWECQPQMRKKVETCRHFLVRQIRVFHAFCHLDPPHPVERGVSYGNTGESADVQLAMGCHRREAWNHALEKWGFSSLSHSVLALCWNFLYNGACCQGGREMAPSDGEPLRQKEDRAGTHLLLEPMHGSKFYSAGQRPVGPSEHMLHRYLYKTT